MKRVLQLFLNYGLIAAVLVWAGVVGLMAYHVTNSTWRWAFVALSLGGFATVGGILWIRRYINALAHPSKRETKP